MYILALLITILALLITMFVYGAFPVSFAIIRKKPITKKKYKGVCYGINAIIAILFLVIEIVISGAAGSIAPYILWTGIFSIYGVKRLRKKGLIIDVSRRARRDKNALYQNENRKNERKEIDVDFDYRILGVDLNQYKIATIISNDPKKYCEYLYALDRITYHHDFDEKVKIKIANAYIKELSVDSGQKMILLKIKFPTRVKNNKGIATYIKEREDICYEDKIFVLKELGFIVVENGLVEW